MKISIRSGAEGARGGLWLIAVLALLGGCIPQVHYKPSTTVAPKPLFPLRVSVQPFKDGTDDPRRPKQFIIPAVFLKYTAWANMTRSPDKAAAPAWMPPEFWTKAFAAELRHQGLFADVTLGQAADAEVPDLLIEGTILKCELESKGVLIVIIPVYVSGRQDYSLLLRARRASDRKILWEGRVERSVQTASGSGDKMAAIAQSLYVEAAQSLVKALQANPQDWQGASLPAGQAGAPAASTTGGSNESVEDILKRISN